jgi:O-succinylbenzoic acid--CoA ligase
VNSNNLDDLFLASGEIQYSYKDLYAFAAYFHDRMQNHERRPEQPIGLCGSSSDEMIFIIASCWLLDIPFIVFNEQLPSQKLTEQINRLKPALIIADSPENIKYQHCLFINEFNPKKILRLGSNIHISWVQKAASVNPSSIFAYFFTSGTSGSPKIVPLKRRQMISAAESSTKNIHPAKMNAGCFVCLYTMSAA